MKAITFLPKVVFRTLGALFLSGFAAVATGLLAINFYYVFTSSSAGVSNVYRMVDFFVGLPTFVLVSILCYFISKARYLKKNTQKSRF